MAGKKITYEKRNTLSDWPATACHLDSKAREVFSAKDDKPFNDNNRAPSPHSPQGRVSLRFTVVVTVPSQVEWCIRMMDHLGGTPTLHLSHQMLRVVGVAEPTIREGSCSNVNG